MELYLACAHRQTCKSHVPRVDRNIVFRWGIHIHAADASEAAAARSVVGEMVAPIAMHKSMQEILRSMNGKQVNISPSY